MNTFCFVLLSVKAQRKTYWTMIQQHATETVWGGFDSEQPNWWCGSLLQGYFKYVIKASPREQCVVIRQLQHDYTQRVDMTAIT